MENPGRKLTINGYISIALLLQIIVLLIRLSGALLYKNYALIFESFHILTDIMVTAVVYVSIRISSSTFSQRYAYGLFRLEDVVSLFISILIAFTAVDLLRTALTIVSVGNLGSSIIEFVSTVPLFFSGLVKIIGGKKVNSTSLTSDGYHNYSDVYVGLGVAIGLILTYFTHLQVFYYLSIAVAAIAILYTSVIIGRDSIVGIMDLPKDKRVIPRIDEIVRKNRRVTGIKSIKARWAGPSIFVEIVLTVNSKLTIEEAHDVADELEEELLKEVQNVRNVVIHIEPSRSSRRIVMVPISEDNKISMKSAKTLHYLLFGTENGKSKLLRRIDFSPEDVATEKNARRVLKLARDNGVTDVIVLGAGEILISLLNTNHITLWEAESDSVDDNVSLFLENRLTKLPIVGE